jgi:hypothetical protein
MAKYLELSNHVVSAEFGRNKQWFPFGNDFLWSEMMLQSKSINTFDELGQS